MEYEAAEYQKLEIRQYPPRSIRETAEGKYWKRFKTPVVAKQVGAHAAESALERRYACALVTWLLKVLVALPAAGCVHREPPCLESMVGHGPLHAARCPP